MVGERAGGAGNVGWGEIWRSWNYYLGRELAELVSLESWRSWNCWLGRELAELVLLMLAGERAGIAGFIGWAQSWQSWLCWLVRELAELGFWAVAELVGW